MDKNEFTNRDIDKVDLTKSKEYMWKYIQKNTSINAAKQEKPNKSNNFFNFIFMMPKRLASYSAIAVVLILSIVAYQLNFKLPFGGVETVYAEFQMEANTQDSTGIDPETSFTLTASEDVSEDFIEESLKVEPEVDVQIKKVGEGEFEITPSEELEVNDVYTFSLETADQSFSWAYQVQDNFKVYGTLPGDKIAAVKANTGIEIYFSHEQYDFDNISDYFDVSPATQGLFEQHRKALVFVPTNGLTPETIYTVTVKAGLPVVDSDKVLAEDYTFQFETSGEPAEYGNSYFSFTQEYYESAVKEELGVMMNYNSRGGAVPQESFEVEFYKFADVDAYIKELERKNTIPSWCNYSCTDFRYNLGGLQPAGSFEAILAKKGYLDYFYIPSAKLDAGVYVMQTAIDGKDYQTILQVTDLSAYYNISETDTLVWVNDLSTESQVQNAKVEIIGVDDTFKTDKDGVATFTTESTWKNDYRNAVSFIIKVTAPDGKVLVNTFTTYSGTSLYDQYWKSITLDRPKYQPTDTINLWGFIKPKHAGVSADNLNATIVKGWPETVVDDVDLQMLSDNTFTTTFELKNMKPGSYSVVIKNGDDEIAYEYFEVANYVKPAYDLVLESDRKAAFAGDTLNFKVKSQFFDGTPFPNLDVIYYDYPDEKTYQTDDNGELDLSFVAEPADCSKNYCYDSSDFYLNISSQLGEETEIDAYSNVRVFDSKLHLATETEITDENTAVMDIKANWIDISRLNDESAENYYDFLGEVAANRKVKAEVTEISWNKTESGQHYDYINKRIVKDYDYNRLENVIKNFEVTTDSNGEASYQLAINPDNFYRINFTTIDDNGNTEHHIEYIYGKYSSAYQYSYYGMQIVNGEEYEDVALFLSFSAAKKFDTGETVIAKFSDSEVPLADNVEGTFLYLQEANGIRKYDIEDGPTYSFKFQKEHVPNINIEGVWFNGRTYETAFSANAAYKRELEKLNIEVEANKESYKPGEEVTLKVSVTDKDGKSAPAEVNLNLVDEAYYKVVYDNFTDPLDDIYMSTGTGTMGLYKTHVTPFNAQAMDGGKGGCFTGETLILMADGTYKPIKDIQKGDRILTKKSEWSSELVSAEVTSTIIHTVDNYLVINNELEVTGEHVVFVNGAWDLAENIRIGDHLLNKDGLNIEVYSIDRAVREAEVFNFEVEGLHTYIADDFYVHNDKGGDGIRNDFEDTALFETIEVGNNGKGEVTFQLPDNITSWRVVAKAIDAKNLKAGSDIGSIKVSLPFFTDLVMNKEYSVYDSPILKFRAFGDALKSDDEVKFKIAAKSLGLEMSDEISGKAYEGSYYGFDELIKGNHEVTVFAESGEYEDALQKTMSVVGSRLKKNVVSKTRFVEEGENFDLAEKGATEIRFMDGGAASYYNDLLRLYYIDGERLDQRLSRVIANDLLKEYFGEDRYVNAESVAMVYQDQGLMLMPYGESDLKLTALALYAETDVNRYDNVVIQEYLNNIYTDTEANLDEVALSLLGLASMNEPVLLSLQQIKDEPKLDLEEKLYVAMALQKLGSYQEAKEIYNDVFDQLAEENTVYETALAMMLTSGLGMQDQAELLRIGVDKYPLEDDIVNLYMAAYLRNSLMNVKAQPVKFKVQFGSMTESVELEGKCEIFSVYVQEGDNVSVSGISGNLAAVTFYEENVEPEDFEVDDSLKISRSYRVDGVVSDNFKEGDLVEVTLNPQYTGSINRPFFSITDTLPSGLTPVTSPSIYWNSSSYEDGFRSPYNVDKQEVHFFWYAGNYSLPQIKYYARVITPGDYYADPAKIESYEYEDIVNISSANRITINPKN